MVRGIALAAGGVKGAAHLALLEKTGDVFDVVTGSSIGSIVGALYALHGDPHAVREITFSIMKKHLHSLKKTENEGTWKGMFQRSLFRADLLFSILKEMFGRKRFSDCKKKLGVVVFDTENMESLLVTEGFLIDAVVASSSVPGYFEPIWLGGNPALDGGVLSPTPVSQARELGADFVVASSFSRKRDKGFKNHFEMFFVMDRWKEIILEHEELSRADFVVVHNVNESWSEFERYYEIYKKALEDLKGVRWPW
ncbi:patatin-like phospholipase family protein [Thermotoga sp.]|uniref:patatin-like phospholipase family protein n=1 Tax=Thermotoga sp. TaxID=28240 RepID=UPI0025CD62BE|nr:patatin-like phospholipase family protein [Thermotoga sp.]MCD6551990.1 patatin-like phospholipase family protein [Thermotoga sp.]